MKIDFLTEPRRFLSQSRQNSEGIYQKLCEVLPGGVNSPVRSFPGLGMCPLIAERAQGALLYDADDNEYIDYCSSWGALICGHAHPKIIEKTISRIQKGSSFGCTTSIEEQLARKLISLVPSLEKVRFVSSGTEATMSAVRLARGFTKKNLVVKFSGAFHGHSDGFLIEAGSGVATLATSSSAGVPQEYVTWTASLPYNNEEAFLQFLHNDPRSDQLACVILEPVAANMGVVPATQAFLDLIRKETKKRGALLIFDEVITGFRVTKGGAQQLYQIEPDLTCFGKIIGGGFPVACYGGKREIMDYIAPLGPVYQSGTLSGNPVAMEAGLQVLELLDAPGFYEKLQKKTEFLTTSIRAILQDENSDVCLQEVGSMFTLFFGKKTVSSFDDAKACYSTQYANFFTFLFDQGVYFSPSQYEACFLSIAHTNEQLQKTVDVIREYFLCFKKM